MPVHWWPASVEPFAEPSAAVIAAAVAAALVAVAVPGPSAIVVVVHILGGSSLGGGAFDAFVEFAAVERHASGLWAVVDLDSGPVGHDEEVVVFGALRDLSPFLAWGAIILDPPRDEGMTLR